MKEKPISSPKKILRRKSVMTSLTRKEFLPFESGNEFSLKVIILHKLLSEVDAASFLRCTAVVEFENVLLVVILVMLEIGKAFSQPIFVAVIKFVAFI